MDEDIVKARKFTDDWNDSLNVEVWQDGSVAFSMDDGDTVILSKKQVKKLNKLLKGVKNGGIEAE